ncbi:MAG TPA: hypothetical protein VJ385_17160 [Fibrobacteria bacterium]|nr:hypothetical protein [Fibrobacteria bacterium]
MLPILLVSFAFFRGSLRASETHEPPAHAEEAHERPAAKTPARDSTKAPPKTLISKPQAKDSAHARTAHESPPAKPKAKESGHEEAGHGAHAVEPAAKNSGHGKADPETRAAEPQAHEGGHEAAGHDPHAAHESGTHAKEGGHGADAEETTPYMAPKPDSTFARAVDWNNGTAEILGYAVKRNGKSGEYSCQGKLVTERMFLHPDGQADRKSAGKEDVEILNAVLACSGDADGSPFSSHTVAKFPRRESLRLLRQDQSLQAWPGATHRSLDCRVTPPRLRVVSSGGEPARDTVLSRWPVYTEEMLFTYVRALPQRAGYREEVWLQDWGSEGRLAVLPKFASISVHSKTSAIRETDTWYVTVDREDGRRSEFWVSTAALHPVVLAILADRSTWTLQEIARSKYWPW